MGEQIGQGPSEEELLNLRFDYRLAALLNVYGKTVETIELRAFQSEIGSRLADIPDLLRRARKYRSLTGNNESNGQEVDKKQGVHPKVVVSPLSRVDIAYTAVRIPGSAERGFVRVLDRGATAELYGSLWRVFKALAYKQIVTDQGACSLSDRPDTTSGSTLRSIRGRLRRELRDRIRCETHGYDYRNKFELIETVPGDRKSGTEGGTRFRSYCVFHELSSVEKVLKFSVSPRHPSSET